MSFTENQIQALQAPLDASAVKTRTQAGRELSYVEGWHAIAEANRIFGFDGWTRELADLTENTQPTQNQKGNWIVSFRARVRVTAHGIVREGTGFGSGISRDIHDAYESAVKEAETDAMKRALMTFGNPFGLALYDKTHANVDRGEPEQKQPPKNADSRAVYSALETAMRQCTSKAELRQWIASEETKAQRAKIPADWDKSLRQSAADFGKDLPDGHDAAEDVFPGDTVSQIQDTFPGSKVVADSYQRPLDS